MPEARLFLERKSYRRRRIMDVVRILPLVCALLWMVVPTMLPHDAAEAAQGAQTKLSTALWYLFAVWVLAIAASFALWRKVRTHDAQHPRGAAAQPPGASADGRPD